MYAGQVLNEGKNEMHSASSALRASTDLGYAFCFGLRHVHCDRKSFLLSAALEVASSRILPSLLLPTNQGLELLAFALGLAPLGSDCRI